MSSSDRPKGSQPDAGSSGFESQRLFELLKPAVESRRLYLEDVSVHVSGDSRTVSVVVDLDEEQAGGVSLDTIAEVSRELTEVMDADPHNDDRPFDLEVSSPGVSRPLTEPRHWRRARGRLAKVNVLHGENFTGRILEVHAGGVTFRPELEVKKGMKPKQGQPVTVPFEQIRRGTVEVEFSHADELESGEELETSVESAGEEN